MKSFRDLTNRYMKKKKTRTILTLMGIVLSVAMIISIGSLTISIKSAVVDEVEYRNGSYDGVFEDLNLETINRLKYHVDMGEVGLSERLGYIRLDGGKSKEVAGIKYIELNSYDKIAMNINGFNLINGRFPELPNEIAIEQSNILHIDEDVYLGKKIQLPLGDLVNGEFRLREKIDFTIVGYIEKKDMEIDNYISRGVGFINPYASKYDVYFKLRDMRNPYKTIDKIALDLGIDEAKIRKNDQVLRLFTRSMRGSQNYNILVATSLIIGLIVVSASAVIYNSFNISIIERIEEFGLLRTVGATPSQIRTLVYKESFLLSLVGIPLGIVMGQGLIGYMVSHVNKIGAGSNFLFNMNRQIHPKIILLSVILSAGTIFLSSLGPATKAGKTSVIENLKGNIRVTDKILDDRNKHKKIGEFFGIEIKIAYKNLKRNRSRFFITVFSMVVSIVLFISFSTFLDMTFDFQSKIESDIDFRVYGYSGEMIDLWEEKLEYMEEIQSVRAEKSTFVKIEDDNNDFSFLEDEKDKILLNDVLIRTVDFTTISDENLIDGDLNNANVAILLGRKYRFSRKESLPVSVGDDMKFKLRMKPFESSYSQAHNIKVDAIVEDFRNRSSSSFIEILVSEEIWDNIQSEIGLNEYFKELIIISRSDEDLGYIRNSMENMKNLTLLDYYDHREYIDQEKTMYSIISMLLYGFVFIITLISCINIFNTISTNILLRSREIAILKIVGMSQGSIVKMVSLEGLFYGLYSIVIGGLLSSVIIFTVFGAIRDNYIDYGILLLKNIGLAAIGFTIVSLIAANYPLLRLRGSNIVENVKKSTNT